MEWRGRRQSSNIEDRRGRGGVARAGGIGGIGVVLALIGALVFGIDPSVILRMLGGGGGGSITQTQPMAPNPAQQDARDFAAVVLADTEDTWNEIFRRSGSQYREPTLVLFSGRVQSACGFASSAAGPFYCPGDQKLYIDLTFFDELKRKFGAPGDFAQAYVVAHEVGHHVQTITGVAQKVRQAQARASKTEANQIQVRMELQADCYAGVWANHTERTKGVLERGDIEEALRAANAIGDDTLQKRSQGYVVPDAFTHGSAEQRMRWFMTGFETGDPQQCDTFNARRL